MEEEILFTGADALNDALQRAGIKYIFCNLGTDYPPIIESWAKAEKLNNPLPGILIAPHEYVGVSAAQGYAQVSGKPAAVFVHVDVGTQNMGGAVHNACRCRIPMFIFSGLSPFTIDGEMKGYRDAYIQYIQNVPDQASIVRQYCKLSAEVRTGKNMQQNVFRALQLSESAPQGPVYLTAAREPLEEECIRRESPDKYKALSLSSIADTEAEIIADALVNADMPLIITSYIGRNKNSVSELVELAENLAIPVLQQNPNNMNFPHDNKLFLNGDTSLMSRADVILCLDCDLPFPSGIRPDDNARIFSIDIDPIKETIPLWQLSAEIFVKADCAEALKKINGIMSRMPADPCKIGERRKKTEALFHERERLKHKKELSADSLSAEYICGALNKYLKDSDIILNEAISPGAVINEHIKRTLPGSFFMSGGSSLGWFGGAAIGAKLAEPDKRVIALVSDGVFIFSCPTAVYWMAKKYDTPFMTVIFNNEGLKTPKLITDRQHPEGYAKTENNYHCDFTPGADLSSVAAAAGEVLAIKVNRQDELNEAFIKGFAALDEGKSVVIDIKISE